MSPDQNTPALTYVGLACWDQYGPVDMVLDTDGLFWASTSIKGRNTLNPNTSLAAKAYSLTPRD